MNVNIKRKARTQQKQGNSTNDIPFRVYILYKYYQKQYEKETKES